MFINSKVTLWYNFVYLKGTPLPHAAGPVAPEVRIPYYLPSSSPKKITQNYVQFLLWFWELLGSFWGRFGSSFGRLWAQISLQIHLGIGLTSKRSISLKHYKNQYKINKNAPRAPPKTILNRPKSVPGCYFSGLRFRPRFGIDFGFVWGRFWLPFGLLLAPFRRSKTMKK